MSDKLLLYWNTLAVRRMRCDVMRATRDDKRMLLIQYSSSQSFPLDRIRSHVPSPSERSVILPRQLHHLSIRLVRTRDFAHSWPSCRMSQIDCRTRRERHFEIRRDEEEGSGERGEIESERRSGQSGRKGGFGSGVVVGGESEEVGSGNGVGRRRRRGGVGFGEGLQGRDGCRIDRDEVSWLQPRIRIGVLSYGQS